MQHRRSSSARLRSSLLAATLALSGTGCEFLPPTACTDELRPSVVVTVVDAVAGTPIDGARVIVRDGAFVDTLQSAGPSGVHWMQAEREGTYSVTALRDGYVPWARAGVRVTGDERHVRTVELEPSS